MKIILDIHISRYYIRARARVYVYQINLKINLFHSRYLFLKFLYIE